MNFLVQRILVPFDFSPAAKQALRYAREFALKFHAELHLLHVVTEPLSVPGSDSLSIHPSQSVPNRIQSAETQLAAQVEQILLPPDCTIQCVVEVGHPVEQIIRYARDKEIDFIIAGTRGKQGLSHLLLGSVAEKLVRLATCPVLTVHPPASP